MSEINLPAPLEALILKSVVVIVPVSISSSINLIIGDLPIICVSPLPKVIKLSLVSSAF
ncbi:MAG: hypothetical protein OQJ88_01660 [Flavobacteriales bacterium]|nr:hypothetical protein [Flavobacteriales bacterium]MCW8968621.1 hypothetical protein [Flavobacteriales bacterium]